MRPLTLVIIFLALWPTQVYAQEPPPLFTQANQAYTQGQYQQAAAIFEQLIAEQGYSAAVLYNLGNSYALLGDPGRAVLAWERAARLDPSDNDITNNLEVLRNQQGLFQEGERQHAAGILASDQWALLGLACLLLGSIYTLAARLWPRLRPPFLWLTTVWTAALALCLLAVFSLRGEYQTLVVLADDSRLLVSPFAGAASLGSLQAGRLLIPMPEHYGQFRYVQAGDGRLGWIARSQVVAVIPEGEQ